MLETLTYTVKDAIATITLNRPNKVNAFNVQMRDDLYETLTAIRDDPAVRGFLLRGAGDGGFCSGADLTEFGTAPSQNIARLVRRERDLWGLLGSMTKPSIAVLHGYCLGSGLEMACMCDIRIASDNAVMGMPEVLSGLVAAAGGTQTLPRLIGVTYATELLLTGRRFVAQEAYSMGLVTRVVPHKARDSEARKLLSEMLRAPNSALEATKRAVCEGSDLPITRALELEARLATILEESPDA